MFQSNAIDFLKIVLNWFSRKREGERHQFVLPLIHCLFLVCALTEDLTHSIDVPGWCSNQISYPARAAIGLSSERGSKQSCAHPVHSGLVRLVHLPEISSSDLQWKHSFMEQMIVLVGPLWKIIFFVLTLHCDFYVFICEDNSLPKLSRVPLREFSLFYDQLW